MFQTMKKRLELKWIVLLITLVVCHSSLTPLQAGTLVVDDKFLRLNTCIFKNVELELTREDFQTIPNVQAIAAIRQMKMNDQLAFQILYSIECPRANCQIAFTIERITPKVNQFFNYELTIDFLIGSNFKVASVNMTNHKQIFTYEESEKQYLNGQPSLESRQLQDKMIPLLIPNGFNEVSLTGSVGIRHLQQSNIYLLQYNPPLQNSHQWTMNRYFIYFKVVLLPQEYLTRLRSRTQLIFNGFQSTILKQINTLGSNRYNSFELPLPQNQLFVDHRKISEVFLLQSNNQKRQSSTGSFLYNFVLGISLLVCLELGYLAIRNRVITEQRQAKCRRQANQKYAESFQSSTVEEGKERDVQSMAVVAHENEGQIKRNCLQND